VNVRDGPSWRFASRIPTKLQSSMPVIATTESRPRVSRWNQPFAEAPFFGYRTYQHSVPPVFGARKGPHGLRGSAVIDAGAARRTDNSGWSWRIRRAEFPPVNRKLDRLAAIRIPDHDCDLISRGSELIIGPMKGQFPLAIRHFIDRRLTWCQSEGQNAQRGQNNNPGVYPHRYRPRRR
jgi:hypothetical protein